MTIRILLADDHEFILDGVHAMLKREPEFEIIGKVTDGSDAVRLSREQTPDFVVMDLTMPDMSGIEATRLIVAERPTVKVLCLSMHVERGLVLGALEAGASGYLLKDASRKELVHAIRTIINGHVYLSPGIAGMIVHAASSRDAASEASGLVLLTEREREVLQLLAQGESTKQIAFGLHLSAKTVGTHRRHIMGKLNIDNLAGLVRFAIREGLASAEV